MTRALVLNATYEPLGVVSQRRAVVLLLTDRAISVEDDAAVLHSARLALRAPSVVRLRRAVRVPHRATVPLTRRGVFLRDGGRCAYCGATATSVDHVVPRSRGGLHVWENVVAACSRCNHVKGDRDVADMGWHLRSEPRMPSGVQWRVLGTGHPDPRWRRYLDWWGPSVAGSGPAGELRAAG